MQSNKIAMGIAALALSTNLNAALITQNGYTLDTETNIVTNGVLDWIQWDETVGMSVSGALGVYASSGWNLANVAQISGLYNDMFTPITFTATENTYQNLTFASWQQSDQMDNFISLFGLTSYEDCNINPAFGCGDMAYEASRAWFGNLSDGSGINQIASVESDRRLVSYGYTYDDRADIFQSESYFTDTTAYSFYGVALVCDTSDSCQLPVISAVPIPATIWLFGSGLIGLVGLARRKKA